MKVDPQGPDDPYTIYIEREQPEVGKHLALLRAMLQLSYEANDAQGMNRARFMMDDDALRIFLGALVSARVWEFLRMEDVVAYDEIFEIEVEKRRGRYGRLQTTNKEDAYR